MPSRTVILVPEAVADVAEGVSWYEQKDPGLGDQFIECLEEAYNKIADNPLHYPLRFDSFRRILIRKFPYAIYYEHDDQTVLVHYVFHCSQAPERLTERLKRQ